MKQFNHLIHDIKELEEVLASEEMRSYYQHTTLVQIYSANNDEDWFHDLGECIRKVLPNAVLVGASTVGEIYNGLIQTQSTVVQISFFDRAKLYLISDHCSAGEEETTAKSFLEKTQNAESPIKGILLLSTPVGNDSGLFFNTLTKNSIDYPIFGGGAADYANKRKTLVYDGTRCMDQGVVGIVFSGERLTIESHTYLEWHPLSKEMTITGATGTLLQTIDNQPAFSVYEKYLGIPADHQFFQNGMEFPLLLVRGGKTIARTPFFANEKDGSIQLVADVEVGEKFRIGYGNPALILDESQQIHQKMRRFNPQAIYLYSCICRRFLLQQDVDRETRPFNQIAPTAGFYTFGEFCSNDDYHSLLNSTLIAVGLKETDASVTSDLENKPVQQSEPIPKDDPYTNQHTRILSRLLYFIQETTRELENQNEELVQLNKLKNEILGIAAHDLRNPLGVIRGYAELIHEISTEEQKDFSEEIIHESERMLELLNNMLDATRIESGSMKLDKKEWNYIETVERCVTNSRSLADKKESWLSTPYEKAPVMLHFDKGRMEQVLNNLISNAIKFSPRRSEIQIRVFLQGNTVVTQIVDQGPGVPESEREAIFQPFLKGSAFPTAGESSHGLGLSIVKRIVEAHQGKVSVTSNERGATFYFTIPAESPTRPG